MYSKKSSASSKKGTGRVLFDRLEDTDICCGRGKAFINHPGNLRFQEVIRGNLGRYTAATSKRDKSQVVASIVFSLSTEGARFVKKDKASDKWYGINTTQAHEKTGHAIRDHILNMSKKRQQASKQLAIENGKADIARMSSNRSRNFFLRGEAYTTVVKSSPPDDLATEAAPTRRIDEILMNEGYNYQETSSCFYGPCSDLSPQFIPSHGAVTAAPQEEQQTSAKWLLGDIGTGMNSKSDGLLLCKQRQLMEDFIDLFAATTTKQYQSNPPAHLSDLPRQDVLDICSSLTVYEQPEEEEEGNDSSTTIFPTDWL